MKKFLATVLTLAIAVSAIPASSVKTDAATSTDNSIYVPYRVTSCDSGKYKFEKGMICKCNICQSDINYFIKYLKETNNINYESMQDIIDKTSKIDEDKDYSKAWLFYSCPKGLTDDEVIEKFRSSMVAEAIGASYTAGCDDYSYFFRAIEEKKDILPHVKNKHYFAEYIRKFGILQVNEENTEWIYWRLTNIIAISWYDSYLYNYQNEIEYAGLTNQQKIDKWWKDLVERNYFIGSMFSFSDHLRIKDEKPLENVKATINDKSLVFNWSYNGPKKCNYYAAGDKHINSYAEDLGFFITISYDKNFKNAKDYFISLTDNKYVKTYGDGSDGGFNWIQNNFSYTINNVDTNKDIYYKIRLGVNNWRKYYDSPDCYREKQCPYFIGTEEEGNQVHWFNAERPKNGYSGYVSTGVIYKDVSDIKKGDNLILINKKSGKKIVTLKKPKVKSVTKKSKKPKSLTFKVKNAPKVKGYKTGYQVEVYNYAEKRKHSAENAKYWAYTIGGKVKKIGKNYYFYEKKTHLKKNYNSTNKNFKKSGKSYKKVTLSNKKFKNKKNLRVRVRYYIKVGKNTIYGEWSSAKKVKIKK